MTRVSNIKNSNRNLLTLLTSSTFFKRVVHIICSVCSMNLPVLQSYCTFMYYHSMLTMNRQCLPTAGHLLILATLNCTYNSSCKYFRLLRKNTNVEVFALDYIYFDIQRLLQVISEAQFSLNALYNVSWWTIHTSKQVCVGGALVNLFHSTYEQVDVMYQC